MDANHCTAIKKTGDKCTNNAVRHGTRCSAHNTVVKNNGPHTTALKELGYIQKKQLDDLYVVWTHKIEVFSLENYPNKEDEVEEMRKDRELAMDQLHVQHRVEIRALEKEHRAEILETGIDPDELAKTRKEIKRIERDERRINMIHQLMVGRARRLDQLAVEVQQIGAGNNNELAEFARDPQNIHTSQIVALVKQTVEKVLTIPVPEEYRWNAEECSKTPGDIITKCKLTSKAAWQMTAKYCQNEDIYDMGNGIYGKVLDSVWQFVLNSKDKDDLFKILKQEMEDNIGMCAQGNLSRLCNILSGYMDGIGSQESASEILGRELPKLIEIEDVQLRLDKAFEIFTRTKLPVEDWDEWLNPLVESDDDASYSSSVIKDKQGIPIGLKANVNYT